MPKKSTFEVDWKGDDIKRRMLTASIKGVEEVIVDCVNDAQDHVPYRTGAYHDSIRSNEEGVQVEREVVFGEWGSYGIRYALAVELGDPSLVGDTDLGMERDEDDKFTQTVRNKGNQGSLRKASDKNYPNLAGRIKENFDSAS